MSRLRNIFRAWLPFAVAATGFSLLAYASVQQSLRQGANDPQIQLAEDAAAALEGGESPEAVIPNGRVDFSTSLAPFVSVYDADGKPIASSGVLDGKMPDYPLGALKAAKPSAENRVTWQPNAQVRVASVVAAYSKGYVVAGRNLREVEKREAQTEAFAAGAWVATLIGVLGAIAFGEYALGSQQAAT